VGPGDNITALRELFTELLGDPDTVRRIAALMAGTDVRYGRWLSTAPVPGLLWRARPALLMSTGDGHAAAVAAGWKDRVDLVPVPRGSGPAAVLVRPDGYVAYEGDTPDGLRVALTRWFGDEGPSDGSPWRRVPRHQRGSRFRGGAKWG
jgi:hypothetical protein